MATTWLLNLKSPDEYISLSEGLLPLIVFHSFHSIWVQALRWCHQPWGGFCSSWMGGLWTATVLTPGWPIIVVGYQDCSKRGYSSKAYFLPLDINYAEDNFSHFGLSQIETEILGITIYVQNSSLQQILLIQSHLPPPHISVQPTYCYPRVPQYRIFDGTHSIFIWKVQSYFCVVFCIFCFLSPIHWLHSALIGCEWVAVSNWA